LQFSFCRGSVLSIVSESDHVLNLCYNILAGGTCLEDIELRRQDEAWMDALGAKIIPDPTTAGDFLRRFSEKDILTLIDLINDCRVKEWNHQPKAFFKEAILIAFGRTMERVFAQFCLPKAV
jgi:hypothetical protein